MRIIVAGVCVAGKTTLVAHLKELGYDAHTVAQEHSGSQTLWRRKRPDLVVLLDATLDSIRKRRNVGWGDDRLAVQRERLSDVRKHADLYILTDAFSKDEVAQQVINFIGGNDGRHNNG